MLSKARLLLEEWETIIPHLNVDIFKNPSKKEVREASGTTKTIRGLIDNEGTLYIWDASTTLHNDIIKELEQKRPSLYFKARLLCKVEKNGTLSTVQVDYKKDLEVAKSNSHLQRLLAKDVQFETKLFDPE